MATAWYYYKGEQRIGPVSPQQLKGLVLEGKLKRTDSVWKEGLSNAVPAEKVQGLFETANRAPGTSSRKSPAENKARKVEWYYAKGDQLTGPLPLARLLKLATAGELRPGDLVWNESLSGWVRAAEVAELAAVLTATPKAPADSGPAPRNSLKANPSVMSSNTDFNKYYSEELDIYIITREEDLIYKHIMLLSVEDVGVELRNLYFLSSQLDEHYVNVMLKAYRKRLSNIDAEIKSKTPKPSIYRMVVDEIIHTMVIVKTTDAMCDFMFGKPSTNK